ncbi:MAG: hypothetical protein OEU36_01525 [Gammaproteobacteria bacterium]|nr:hypothetical protein [Gammaproteobacteria bacterium]
MADGVTQSFEAWIFTDIKGWTLADSINDEEYEQLLQEAPRELASLIQEEGSVEFAAPAHIISVTA